jgi:hypothetical protein
MQAIFYYIIMFPVSLAHALRAALRFACRPDWSHTAFAALTLGLGPLAMWLEERPAAGMPARLALRSGAWIAAAAGLGAMAWLMAAAQGYVLFLLLPILWFGRRLHACPLDAPEPDWRVHPLWPNLRPLDWAALGAIAALALFQLGVHQRFVPWPPDGYYHLLAASVFQDHGHFPMWADWEFAPLGRPHLYPPGFHVLLATLDSLLPGGLVDAMRVVQATLTPVALASVWFLARWLFDERRAFFAVLICGWDLMFSAMGLLGLPSLLCNAAIMLVVALFMKQRFFAAGFALAGCLYLHMGLPVFAALGLLLFSLTSRERLRDYAPGAAVVFAVAILLAAPWYARLYVFRDWFGHPIDSGAWEEFAGGNPVLMRLLWLQLLNMGIVLFVSRALRLVRFAESRNVMLLCMTAAFLPMLFTYGGRYFGHTMPFWAILAAAVFVPLLGTPRLGSPLRWRRVGLFLVLALVPSVSFVSILAPALKPAFYPTPSGWTAAPVTMSVGLWGHLREGKQALLRLAVTPWEDVEQAGAWIRANTRPEQIIHVEMWGRERQQLATALALASGRPIDTAVWEEVRPAPELLERLEEHAERDPDAVVVRKITGFRRGGTDRGEPRATGRFGSLEVQVFGPPPQAPSAGQ